MECKVSDLVKRGHEQSAQLKSSGGALSQLISDLATQLDVQRARSNALAADNVGLKAAFDKPQAYLSWHTIPPTWEDPLPCGEYLDVHDDAGHKNSDGTDCWPVYAKPEINTPATDAFLAEVRAHDLNAFIRHHSAELDAHIKNGGEQFDEKSVRIRDIIVSARLFREQIRKEAAQ